MNNIEFISNTGGFHGDEVGQVAIICRTNVGVFDQAVRICEEAKGDNKKVKIAFAGVGLILTILFFIILVTFEISIITARFFSTRYVCVSKFDSQMLCSDLFLGYIV